MPQSIFCVALMARQRCYAMVMFRSGTTLPPEPLPLVIICRSPVAPALTADNVTPCDPQELLQLNEQRMVEFITFAPGLLSRRPGTNSWKASVVLVTYLAVHIVAAQFSCYTGMTT